MKEEEKFLPLGIVKGCIMKRDVKKDTPFTYDMVQTINESPLINLRRIQDNISG